MMSQRRRTGVFVVNLGTPSGPESMAVRRYLKEFLSDPYVLTMPAVARWLLLQAIILPFRSLRSAKAYQKVWTESGSPLMVFSKRFVEQLEVSLGDDYHVVLSMRYGEPSIQSGLAELQHCEDIIVISMYPQYANATTQSLVDKVEHEATLLRVQSKLVWVRDFYNDLSFVSAYANQIRNTLAHTPSDFLLMSYHGLPVTHMPKSCQAQACCLLGQPCDQTQSMTGSCYRAQCYQTSRLIAADLGLQETEYLVAFQSRLGATRWVQPYTDSVLESLRHRGITNLAVVCPSFVVDCLETLEEIAIRLEELWLALGGQQLTLVPCLNAEPEWVNAVSQWVKQRSQQEEGVVE